MEYLYRELYSYSNDGMLQCVAMFICECSSFLTVALVV